jgi:hypothetical protein
VITTGRPAESVSDNGVGHGFGASAPLQRTDSGGAHREGMNLTLDTAALLSTNPDRVTSIVDAAIERLGSETLVPQGHCIDVLLDLYTATNDVGLKWSIGERIEELLGRSFVFTEVWRADLEAIVAIADFTRSVANTSAA